MPHSQNKRDKGGSRPTREGATRVLAGQAPSSPAAPHSAPDAVAGANHNGAHSGNGNGNHERRRSGRVTYRPKATAMLTVHARTEDERTALAAPTAGLPRLGSGGGSLRIMSEFVEGFDALAAVGKAITIFGSARTREGDPYYAQARELAANLAREGFAVITGGGPASWRPPTAAATSRRAFHRLQHRAAAQRASGQPVRRPRRRVPLLLRAQG